MSAFDLPMLITNDDRIGKRVRVQRTGEIGTIESLHRFADGLEYFEIRLSPALCSGGYESGDLDWLEEQKQ